MGGSPTGKGAELFGPHRDDEFSRSAAAMLWPFGSLAAGSYWHYDADVPKLEVLSRAIYVQNTLASWRGGMVCPTGCDCYMTSICGESLLPPPVPSPAPSSKECTWKVDTGLSGNDLLTSHLQSKEECCAACHEFEGCAASDFNPMTKVCYLKKTFEPVWRNDGSLACVPNVAQVV